MCLTIPKVPPPNVRTSTIVGYRVASTTRVGGLVSYSPVHQQSYTTFKPAGQVNTANGSKENAGFHVFRKLSDAKAYRRAEWDSNNLAVIKVSCTDIWRVGEHRTSDWRTGEAFTCGKMTIIGQVFPKRKKPVWRKCDYNDRPVAVSLRKPAKSIKAMPWILHDTMKMHGTNYAVLKSVKGKRVKLVPACQLWTLS